MIAIYYCEFLSEADRRGDDGFLRGEPEPPGPPGGCADKCVGKYLNIEDAIQGADEYGRGIYTVWNDTGEIGYIRSLDGPTLAQRTVYYPE
jgi:hypothetical protein